MNLKAVNQNDDVCLDRLYLIRIAKNYFVSYPNTSYEPRENDRWYPLKNCHFIDPNSRLPNKITPYDEIAQIL